MTLKGKCLLLITQHLPTEAKSQTLASAQMMPRQARVTLEPSILGGLLGSGRCTQGAGERCRCLHVGLRLCPAGSRSQVVGRQSLWKWQGKGPGEGDGCDVGGDLLGGSEMVQAKERSLSKGGTAEAENRDHRAVQGPHMAPTLARLCLTSSASTPLELPCFPDG